MKFDMHCHVREGSLDGKASLVSTIRILQKKGYNGMLISDHNTYGGYRYWEKYLKGKHFKDFTVLKGIEYDTVDAGHILVIMPEHVNLRILELRGLPVLLLIDLVHRHGGILGPAHPCGERFLSITNTRKHRNQLSVIEKFDFIETFNACEEAENNRKARALAKLFDKAAFGGSDSHKIACVGSGYTEFHGNITCESDLIELVKKQGRNACYSGGVFFEGTTKNKLGKANHLLVQSFWFYNKFLALWRRKKRVHEWKKQYIRLKR